MARTPVRLEKCMVCRYSGYTVSRISWQLVQNSSVFVASITVLNPPQKTTPATKPPPRRVSREKRALGRRSTCHRPLRNPAGGELWEPLDASLGVSAMSDPSLQLVD